MVSKTVTPPISPPKTREWAPPKDQLFCRKTIGNVTLSDERSHLRPGSLCENSPLYLGADIEVNFHKASPALIGSAHRTTEGLRQNSCSCVFSPFSTAISLFSTAISPFSIAISSISPFSIRAACGAGGLGGVWVGGPGAPPCYIRANLRVSSRQHVSEVQDVELRPHVSSLATLGRV